MEVASFAELIVGVSIFAGIMVIGFIKVNMENRK